MSVQLLTSLVQNGTYKNSHNKDFPKNASCAHCNDSLDEKSRGAYLFEGAFMCLACKHNLESELHKSGNLDSLFQQKENPYTDLVQCLNVFSNKLLTNNKLKGKSEQTCFSPLSVLFALLPLVSAANGKTLTQLLEYLGLADKKSVHRLVFQLTALKNQLTNVQLANGSYVQKGLTVLDEFKAKIDALGIIEELDFSQDEASRLHINQWIASKTNDLIKELIPSGVINAQTVMVLTNALYFKSDWVRKFDSDDGIFNFVGLDGAPKLAYRMADEVWCNYYEDEKCQVVELPYENGSSMGFILPKIDEFKRNEKFEIIPEPRTLPLFTVSEYSGKFFKKLVSVQIPKITQEVSLGLKNLMQDQGVTELFEEGKADLSGITGTPNIFVQDALHKVVIKVNKEGTEAAAATAFICGLESCCMPQFDKKFVADHTFQYYIKDDETEVIFFSGVYDGDNEDAPEPRKNYYDDNFDEDMEGVEDIENA